MTEEMPELVISGNSWATIHKVPHADVLMSGNYRLKLRKTGKGINAIYEKHVIRPIDIPNGKVEEVIAKLFIASYSLSDAEVSISHQAIGGGQGHYDYGTVANMSGWVILTKDEVIAMKALVELEKMKERNARAARKLEKQAALLRK